MSFESLGVASCFIGRLKERGITVPTDIQQKVIPHLTAKESIFFTSATGTGKTFAYLLPLLGRLLEEGQAKLCFLIAAPTLELCTQIKGELDFLLENTDVRCALLIGSVNLERQIETLKKINPQIIVGNPNRLLLLAKKKLLRLNNLQYLVLDEADRLVSDEMLDDTNELCKIIHRTKKADGALLIGACSATMNKKNTDKLFKAVMSKTSAPLSKGGEYNIAFIESQGHEILQDKIEHWAIFSEKRRKDQTLRSLLAALKGKKKRIKALVFTSRGDEAALALLRLQHHKVNAKGLFGKIGHKPLGGAQRKEALDLFSQGKVDVLVSTDLAARGLDIQGITHIISLDVPSDDEVYIHRCGRTARAGKRGVMITIGDETQMRLLAVLEKKLKIRVQPKELHYGQVCAPEL